MILADAYELIGDTLAETLRWMAENDRRPWRNKSASNKPISWNSSMYLKTKSTLPVAIFDSLEDGEGTYGSVKDATLDLHEAISSERVATAEVNQ